MQKITLTPGNLWSELTLLAEKTGGSLLFRSEDFALHFHNPKRNSPNFTLQVNQGGKNKEYTQKDFSNLTKNEQFLILGKVGALFERHYAEVIIAEEEPNPNKVVLRDETIAYIKNALSEKYIFIKPSELDSSVMKEVLRASLPALSDDTLESVYKKFSQQVSHGEREHAREHQRNHI